MIILIRHAEPDYVCLNKLSLDEMRNELDLYNQSGIKINFSDKTKAFISEYIQDADIVLSSSIRRAKDTALLFFHEDNIRFLYELREFDLVPQPFLFKRNSFSTYVFFSRLYSILGLKVDNCESYHEANERVIRFSKKLLRQDTPENKIVIFGHGFFFRSLRKLLKQSGYKIICSTGHKYLSLNSYESREK